MILIKASVCNFTIKIVSSYVISVPQLITVLVVMSFMNLLGGGMLLVSMIHTSIFIHSVVSVTGVYNVLTS